ncbi:MAG TPA: hypothetical protein VM577_06460, partial [Anaerovoracaceae bacterium]|nr:hypothetical protein [Anaerovoracaceae bacterium]
FASQGKDCIHILDMVFGLPGGFEVPSIQEKRDNGLMVKKELMKEISSIDFEPEIHEWDELALIIGDEIQMDMAKKLISAADIKEAIWLAENSGDKFFDESDGTCLCSMVKSELTYWVQYKETASKTYEIFSAYSHRMRFSREG